MHVMRKVLVLFLLLALGCAGGGNRLRLGRSGRLQEGVDPARAFLSLDQIEPQVHKPAPTTAIKPLSKRASQKIALAWKLIGQTRYTEAAIELERALRYDPNHPDIHRTLASLHWEAGNTVRARTHAERALKVRPDDAVAQYLLGRCHHLAGERDEAIRSFRTALLCSDLNEHPEVAALCHYYLAEVLADDGYLQASLDEYAAFETRATSFEAPVTRAELAALLASRSQTVALARANVQEKLGRFGEAADSLAPLAARAPDDVPLGSRFVKLLIRARRYADALAAVRRLPYENSEVLDLLMEVRTATGHPERVVDDLHARMAGRGDDAKLVLNLASVLVQLQQSEAACGELQRFLDAHASTDADAQQGNNVQPGAHTDTDAVRNRLVDVLLMRAKWHEAIQVAAEGIQESRPEVTALTDKFRALAKNGVAVHDLLDRAPAELSAPAAYLTGVLAMAADRLPDAEKWLRKSREADSDFVPARVALATVYLRSYQYDDALRVASRANENTPEDSRLELVLGRVYERLDNADAAERHFQTAIQLDRRDPRSMFALAKLYHDTRRRLQAQRQLRALLENRPDHERARELLAYIYVEEGKLDVATEQLEKLRKTAKTPLVKARCAAFLEHIDAGEPAAYRQSLLDAMEQYGQDADTWLAVAQSYDLDRESGKRREALRNALSLDHDNEEASLALIETSRRMLDFEGAIALQEGLLRKRPNRHGWRLGFVQRRGGRVERLPGLIQLYWIVQDFDAALRIAETQEARDDVEESTQLRYRQAIVDTLRRAHRDAELVKRLKRWVEQEPDQEMYARLLASEYLEQEKPLQAIPLLKTIYEKKKSWPSLGSLLEAMLAAERFDQAAQYVLAWLDGDPEDDTALLALPGILSAAGRTDDALELIRNRLLPTLQRERFQSRAVWLLRRAKRYDQALDLVERLIDEVAALLQSGRKPHLLESDLPLSNERIIHLPDEPFTPERLHARLLTLRDSKVDLLLASRDYAAAERELTTWLDAARAPGERFGYLWGLAICLRLKGNEERADETMRRALVLQPNHPTLNNDLAYVWIDQGVHLDEAEGMIRSALWKDPFSAAYLDTYGWLKYKQGAFAEARKWLERANQIRRGDDPVLLSHLGDALWRLGESDKAVRRWEEAVAASDRRPNDAVISDDEKRTTATTRTKIKSVRAGADPPVAPLKMPSEPARDQSARPASN